MTAEKLKNCNFVIVIVFPNIAVFIVFLIK